GFFSSFAGYIGLRMATAANARTTTATEKGLDAGLKIAFSSGSVMGFVVVGLGLLDLSAWYFTLNHMYADMPELERVSHIASTMLSFGMGASLQALFARVGGGIYTKAADVGADLVGKVEAGIPEDDVRNPATIADNVGDNVGDVAGMGADLYESYVGSIVASMALAAAAGLGLAGTLLPLGIAAVGVASSLFGTIFVKAREGASQLQLLGALRKGIVASAVTVALLSWFLVHSVMSEPFRGVYWAILTGLLAGVLIGFATEYFTSDCYKPARSISKSAETGSATVIISGLGIGMFSTALPVIIIVAAITVAFYAAGGNEHFMLGLYGIGIAAVGMLSTLGMTLATDSYGPVADNAGGIAQMSKRPQLVRDRTDALDALGNTTAATGKGFAIGSAALTGLTLITAYRIDVVSLGHQLNLSVDNPKLIAGLFLGGMLPFLFCALCINAVGNAASSIVTEVRRQFREIVGLLGPNGAGKTTTFYMVTGIVPADEGQITFDNRKITRMPMYKRARIGLGYLSQEPSIFRHLTVEQNIMAVLETLHLKYSERKRRLEELLSELKIERVRHSKAATLSGGERRRLEITRALVAHPTCILLDEPFSGIDPIAVSECQELIKDLKNRGIGVLLTDHNVRETLAITDRAYIMADGMILVHGSQDELLNNEDARRLYLGEKFSM
ncbi:MAG: sodium-translocating pyrophosphatase, partial [Candidatus Omnitrophica bacterium]|nr:sodium-translocating pyrophosphatase [Candidatus Omnitrophota bacterium]